MLPNNKYIVVVGYSGHAYVMIDAALGMNLKIKGYFEKRKKNLNPFNIKYLGSEDDKLNLISYKDYSLCIGIGDNNLRSKISNNLRKDGFHLINIFHPNSKISNNTNFGSGVFVARNAVINPLCDIGNDVIINTSATIDHECKISDNSHIAPGAVLLGNVNIGTNSFIGANSVIKEGINIGNNVIIGAGSVILDEVEDNSLVYGNPGKIQ